MELLPEQTDDAQTEIVLLSATKDAKEALGVQELCRGLARIKSKEGVRFIARVALASAGDSDGSQCRKR